MRRAMSSAIIVLALFATAGKAGEGTPKDQGTTDPKGVSLELKVVVKKDTYAMDLGDKTPEEFAKLLAEAEKTSSFPPASAVDLGVELRNAGDKDLLVWVGGDNSELVIELGGRGARNLTVRLGIGRPPTPPKVMKLPPAKLTQSRSSASPPSATSANWRSSGSRFGRTLGSTPWPPATTRPSPRR